MHRTITNHEHTKKEIPKPKNDDVVRGKYTHTRHQLHTDNASQCFQREDFC